MLPKYPLPKLSSISSMAQKVILRVSTMKDEKTKQKAMEAAADILGVDSIAAEVENQKLTVVGDMDVVALVKKVVKKMGKVYTLAVSLAAN
ncbi:heavy metal-associated isoprenylated plant protein 39-like [Andrographis paniculata]|uniref:heavy metal-associated isoprenylated plant protein 39-like n=1 Tax=Andrographis paniculata TaxID=175694 RepID=UPI0021E9507B|nr:heavy metal-associated isoprenylated plant protein 39-like [Andrographis paniculata]